MLNPKLKSTGAGRYQLLSRWWDALPQAAWPERLLSEKSGRCGIAADWAMRRFTYDWSWWYPSGNRPLLNIWASAGRWLWPGPEHKADSLIAKFKEAGGTVRDWCMSRLPRLSPLWLSASSSACHGLLIITVDNAITYKAQRQKCQRTEAGERGNYWHADASARMLLRSMQNTRRS